ncbi:hypothetical protein SDC9_171360 [bioreactor metagenome]|uniref:Uncharacterized protein n=1 Tax=bioreactor metagenome TaxID=1076179 RepID=A0A645GAM2_9ZZZZ
MEENIEKRLKWLQRYELLEIEGLKGKVKVSKLIFNKKVGLQEGKWIL